MKWQTIFRVYSIKRLKKEKILFLFTAMSILLATTISILIPCINIENERFIERNIEKVNDGDLSIELKGPQSDEFYKLLEERTDKGDIIRESKISNCYYKKDSNNIIGNISIGDYNLEGDEIILQRRLADTLSLNVGDFVELDTSGNGRYKYKVIEIEEVATGVTNDAKLLGYGKIKKIENLKGIEGTTIIGVDTDNPVKLKDTLSKVNNLNEYKTIEDVRLEIKDELFIQKVTLSILTVVGFIFSALAIVSTTIVIILKRKRDIAILRILTFDLKEIRKAFVAEISLWILLPILLSGVISYFSLEGILSISGISIAGISNESIVTMLKGMSFNTVLFFLLINISLILLKGITPISIFREDNNILRKTNKKVFLIAIFMIPILLIIYSVFCGEIENIGGIAIVTVGILIFLGMIAGVIKILSKMRFKNYELMYSIKSIKNNFSYFVLVVLSLTMTLWVMLIGFNLENAIKENYNEALDNSLPYNYYIKSEEETEKILESSLEVEGVIKYSAIEGIVKNREFNDYFRTIEINEVDEKDYGIDFRIIEGENLFEGEEGILISDVLQSKSRVKVNDVLEIETSKGVIEKRVKGIYKSGGVNTVSILKENVELGDGTEFLVKATSGEFIDNLKNSSVIAVDDLGEKMGVYVSGFLKLFRIVSIICFLGTILFNINVVYINCSKDERDEEILLSLGRGKEFILRGNIIKIIISMSLAVILSIGVYGAVVKLFFAMMFNMNGEISVEIVFINIILGLIISIISFRYPFKKIVKKKELELLRID